MQKIKVAVYAADPVSAAGLRDYVLQSADLELTQDAPQVRVVLAERRSAGVFALLDEYKDAGILQVLVGELPEDTLLRALDAGLRAIVPPQFTDVERLARTVRAVVAGGTLLPPHLVTELVRHIHRVRDDVLTPNGLSSSGLTTREVEVLRLLAEGYDTAEIAVRLNWAERTVKNVVRALNTRLNLRNRTHLVSWAMRNDLI